MNKVTQAGFYVLERFLVTPLYESNRYEGIDLSKVIVNWNFTESMDSSFISGSATVVESFDMLTGLPMRGEENLQITFRDQFNNQYSYNFVIYAVTDIEQDSYTKGSSKLLRYTISFCTPQKLNHDWQFVRKSYGNELISNMAQDVFDKYMTGERDIEVELTHGKQTLVIPKLRPDEAMNFLARRAYNTNRESNLYFFFENTEKYYFCTYEYLVDKYIDQVKDEDVATKNNLKYIYSQVQDASPYGQSVERFVVSNLSYNDRSNSINAMKRGAYKRKITELDYYNRSREVRVYDYANNINEHSVIDDLKVINTQDYINRYMPDEYAPEAIYVTDYNQIGDNQGKNYSLRSYPFYAENFMRKSMVSYHLNNSSVSCTVNGNGELKAGMMIWLEVPKFSEEGGKNVIDTERNGRYLIKDITHVFSGDYYVQNLSMTKGGLAKG